MATQDKHESLAHKAWIGYLQPVGVVVSPPALIKAQAYVNHNVIEPQRLLQNLVAEDDEGLLALTDFPAFTQEILKWLPEDLADSPPALEVALPDYEDILSATWAVADAEREGKHLLLIKEIARGADLDEPGPQKQGWRASPQARMERLLRSNAISAGVLFNGTHLRLIYAPSGETSGHVTFPFRFMTEVSGRLVLGAMLMLLEADRIFEGPLLPEQRLPALFLDSGRYQHEVSTHLAEQVLDALWELLRGFQTADSIAKGRVLNDISREDPQHIYGGLLTALLRLIFLLYAEDRGLMPGHPVYQAHYSVAGLFERLREDAGLYPDTMDQRFGAWAGLLSLFRLAFDGAHHQGFHLPARHGQLFDPDAFPFLEGRPYATARLLGAKLDPPQVSDGVIYRVLRNLLILHGERLSYRALDVEQLGSVYEAMMGFEVERAAGPSIALKPSGGKAAALKGHVVVDLQELLNKPGKDRKKWLKAEANCDITGAPATALKKAASIDDLIAALTKKISPRTKNKLPTGSLYLQPGEERRRTGSHYTPRELTEPIVTTTLRPVFEALGEDPTPDQILGLKVCDPAMGSGAFLVEACRHLADHLLSAWERHDSTPTIPPDEEPILHARRLVAQRCLYGVDKNPFAVDLAKLSLWLITLAKDHAFTFLDHALKCGDSLVGLTKNQIMHGTWMREDIGDLPLVKFLVDNVGAAKLYRDKLAALDDESDDEKRRLHRDAEDALEDARLTGDVVIAAFFGEAKDKNRKQLCEQYWHRVRQWRSDEIDRKEVKAIAHLLLEGEHPLKPFHWEIEFPEVFDRTNPGFDAIVGNPPFLGGGSISSNYGRPHLDWLLALHEGAHGNSDLVAHFYRRAFTLLRSRGTLGLIATNTIAQGDTRSTGLQWICTHNGHIYNATRRLQWPGIAAVVVSVVHITKDHQPVSCLLDNTTTSKITAFLFHRGGHSTPIRMTANLGCSFLGAKVYGQGFTFDDTDKKEKASSLAEMSRLIAKDPRNAERIFPYLGGSEVNTSPTHSHHRYVINFGEMSEEEARQWPDLMAVVEEKVKPERMKNKRAVRKKYWWRFGETAPALYRAITGLERVLVISRVGQYGLFTFLPTSMIFSEALVVFTIHTNAAFCALQSRPHDIWARFFGSSMKDDLRYTPSDCFETFPFPDGWQTDEVLEAAGEAYYEFRAALMIANDEGMTKTYNRFHDPEDRDPEIKRLRELHGAMDRAVLEAYGWGDISTACEFLLDYEIDEEEWSPRKKKPWRYRWSDEVHDEVLARLLALNQRRSANEKLSAPKKRVKKKKKGRKKKAGVRKKKATPTTPLLFGGGDV